MPYVCDNEKLRWVDNEDLPPRVSDFVYMPPRSSVGPRVRRGCAFRPATSPTRTAHRKSAPCISH